MRYISYYLQAMRGVGHGERWRNNIVLPSIGTIHKSLQKLRLLQTSCVAETYLPNVNGNVPTYYLVENNGVIPWTPTDMPEELIASNV